MASEASARSAGRLQIGFCRSFVYNHLQHSCRLYDHDGNRIPAIVHPAVGYDIYRRTATTQECGGWAIDQPTAFNLVIVGPMQRFASAKFLHKPYADSDFAVAAVKATKRHNNEAAPVADTDSNGNAPKIGTRNDSRAQTTTTPATLAATIRYESDFIVVPRQRPLSRAKEPLKVAADNQPKAPHAYSPTADDVRIGAAVRPAALRPAVGEQSSAKAFYNRRLGCSLRSALPDGGRVLRDGVRRRPTDRLFAVSLCFRQTEMSDVSAFATLGNISKAACAAACSDNQVDRRSTTRLKAFRRLQTPSESTAAICMAFNFVAAAARCHLFSRLAAPHGPGRLRANERVTYIEKFCLPSEFAFAVACETSGGCREPIEVRAECNFQAARSTSTARERAQKCAEPRDERRRMSRRVFANGALQSEAAPRRSRSALDNNDFFFSRRHFLRATASVDYTRLLLTRRKLRFSMSIGLWSKITRALCRSTAPLETTRMPTE